MGSVTHTFGRQPEVFTPGNSCPVLQTLTLISDQKTSFFRGVGGGGEGGHISICYVAYIREYPHPLGMTRTMCSLLVLLAANLVSLFNSVYFFFPLIQRKTGEKCDEETQRIRGTAEEAL